MKRLTLALLILLLLFTLTGCASEPDFTERTEITYSSDTSPEDCYLCGNGIESLVPSYWGQKNVAFISLNTFEIAPLEINRYNRLDGTQIKEYAGVVSFQGGGGTDDGFSVRLMVSYDRGFAGGALDFYDDEVLDIDKAASFLCSDCLNSIITGRYGEYYGVGVIDLETKEIRVLEKRVGGFGLGDYYIFCNWQPQERNDTLRMEILVLNCPIRYAD